MNAHTPTPGSVKPLNTRQLAKAADVNGVVKRQSCGAREPISRAAPEAEPSAAEVRLSASLRICGVDIESADRLAAGVLALQGAPSGDEPSVALDRSHATFADDELSEGEAYGTLGPAYFAARKVAAAFMGPFETEHFKPLIDKFASDFQDRLWSDLEASLLSDMESNLQTSMWRMVDASINALLTGEKWALERYVVAAQRYGDAPKVRAAIVEHCREQIAEQRIADLEGEIAKLRQDLEWARR